MNRMITRWISATLAWVVMSSAIPLAAQDLPEMQIQRFRPATGPADYLNVYSTHSAPHLELDFGAYVDYAINPYQTAGATEEFISVVGSQTHLSLIGNIGLWNFMEVGLLVPVALYQSSDSLDPILPPGEPQTEDLGSTAISDIRVTAKATISDLQVNPVGFGFVLAGSIPTGMDDHLVGDESFGLEGIGVAEAFLGRGIRVGLNLGYRFRAGESQVFRDSLIGDEIIWGLAGNFPLFISSLDLIAELDGAVGVATKPDGQGGVQEGEAPAELKLAARYKMTDDWTLTGGFGVGMNSEAIGTPDFRMFVGVTGRWVSGGAWGFDYDGDGIYGAHDKCPDAAEDFDGVEDLDGCPDYDNDGDGVPDDLDKCDNTPEGVAIGVDGCPDNDLDGDGIPNDLDKCPEDPEDLDRFEDSDGCPDPDNDQDGIPDTVDNCPMKPETFNDFLDEDGCPDDPNDKVHIARDRIIITEQVYFDSGKTTIKKKSFDILSAIVEVLQDNPQILKLRIEGHTDSKGAEDMNLTLSQGRADAVLKYLTEKGVAAGRLEAIGYGETRPIRDNDTKEGRSYNRRSEFIILEMRGQ